MYRKRFSPVACRNSGKSSITLEFGDLLGSRSYSWASVVCGRASVHGGVEIGSFPFIDFFVF